MNIKRIRISHSNTHPCTGSYSPEYCTGDGISFEITYADNQGVNHYLILDRRTASDFIKYSSLLFKARCMFNRISPKTSSTVELEFAFSRRWDIEEENRKINNAIAVANIDVVYTGLKLLGIINPGDFKKGQFYIEHKKLGLPEIINDKAREIDRVSFLMYMLKRAEGKTV